MNTVGQVYIIQRFRKPRRGEICKHYSSATIAQMISYGRQPISSRRVSLVLKKLGFNSERNSKGCFYSLVEMNSNESQIVIYNILNNKQIEQDLPF